MKHNKHLMLWVFFFLISVYVEDSGIVLKNGSDYKVWLLIYSWITQ